ncbi:MAG: foldase protein PrsA [Bacteroidota bacterium]
MKKIISLSLMFIMFLSVVAGQDYKDKVLITIDGNEITAGEFERVYKKNNNENVAQQQSVEEYLDMFINYKLKVMEAERLGMDTATQFLKEFNTYKKQLAQPYLTSKELTEEYAREAYERMKEEINASHIMVRLSSDASPEDTLHAYQKIMEIRERVSDGEDFEKVARAFSDDPSAKTNGGRLGWFSAFRMVYPFETVAYNTKVGSISMPVRSNFGYHLIKVHDRRPAKGSIQVAHIFLTAPPSMSGEEQEQTREMINMVYDSLKMGTDFAEMAERYSDDKSSGAKGGVLPWFSSGQMIKVFDSTAFSLEQIGQISEPVRSDYGWHIVKLLDKNEVGSFEEEKPEILSFLKKGDRGKARDMAFIAQLKEDYGYNFHEENYNKMISTLDSTIFDAAWTAEKAEVYFDKPIFTIGDLDVTVEDFAKYFEAKVLKRKPMDYRIFLDSYYEPFETKTILQFEEDNLENKYPEYKYIVQEYHDGILLFDLTDELVWTKAVEDSLGLQEFYEKNKQEYMWGERANTYTVIVKDSTIYKDVRKRASRRVKRNKFDPDKFYERYCEEDTTGNCLEIIHEKYAKGDDELAKAMKWEKGLSKTFTHNGNPSFMVITEILDPEVKKLEETRGLVIADYQKYLEDKWLEELRNEYKIEINRELLSKIKD